MPEREAPRSPLDVNRTIRDFLRKKAYLAKLISEGGVDASHYFEITESMQEDLDIIRRFDRQGRGVTGTAMVEVAEEEAKKVRRQVKKEKEENNE